jgi:microtubule-associated protein-like 6
MGCGGSKDEAHAPHEQAKDGHDAKQQVNTSGKAGGKEVVEDRKLEYDPDLDRELNGYTVDKTGKQKSPYDRAATRPEDNTAMVGMFSMESAGQGEQVLAVKPWKGAIVAPSSAPAFHQTPPTVDYQLEYVYGYRCFDSRQNVFYTSDNNQIVYMTAALGVVLNKNTNTQRFFGGGKASANLPGHSDDITALAVDNSRQLVATGDVGAKPCVWIWNALNQQQVAKIDIGRGRRAVTALAFSHDGQHVVATDLHNDHYVSVWEARTGRKVGEDKGGPDKILDVAWATNKALFVTVGVKHVVFWAVSGGTLPHKKGLYGDAAKMTDQLAAKWANNGNCVTGGANGLVYIWQDKTTGPEPTFNLLRTLDAPGNGATIHSLNIIDDVLYVGARDGKIRAFGATNFEAKGEYNTPNTFARAIDKSGNNLLVGCRDGSIREIDVSSKNARVLMESHSDGEVWGLAVHPTQNNIVVTTGDDNKVRSWDFKARRCVGSGTLDNAAGQERKAGYGASTLASTTPNQQSRAVAVNHVNGHVAVAHNHGKVTVRPSFNQLDQVAFTLNEPKEWTQAMKFSPDGTKLAVGSHDNHIYVYDVNGNYRLIATCKGHSSFITALDWTADSTALHTTCGAYELLFWDAASGAQIKDGASRFRDEAWATWSTPLGWPVQGIFRGVVDYTHVNAADRSKDSQVVAVGNDWGLVEVFGFPNNEGAQSNQYRGHSEHVTNVQFARDDSYIFSAGGYDQTLMQWKRV